jgi:hypothetical protein
VKLITGLLRGRIASVLNGSASPKMPSVEVAIVAKSVPPPQTKLVFLVRASKWLDHDGNQRKSAAYFDATMPVATAAKAIKLGAAVELTDAQRRLHGGKHEASHPPLHRCVDIDNAISLELHEAAPDPVFISTSRTPYKASFGT